MPVLVRAPLAPHAPPTVPKESLLQQLFNGVLHVVQVPMDTKFYAILYQAFTLDSGRGHYTYLLVLVREYCPPDIATVVVFIFSKPDTTTIGSTEAETD